MFIPSSEQNKLFTAPTFLSERKQKWLASSWAPVFRERCWPLIPEEPFRVFYCSDNGAPCKPVRLVVAILILQAIFDLTDAETEQHLMSDLQWLTALGLDPTDDDDFVSQRTLQHFRAKLVQHEMAGLLFMELTDRLIALLGVRTDRQRADSSQVLSHYARMGRLRLFCETMRVFLRALKRTDKAAYDAMPARLRERYLHDDGEHTSFDDSRIRNGQRRLSVAARDVYRLCEYARSLELAPEAAEAALLLDRLLTEHCIITNTAQPAEAGDDDADQEAVPVEVKDAKQLDGSVLQTPHDPDVTYNKHKGQGHVAMLAETCHPDNPVQLITYGSTGKASDSDADRVVPLLGELSERGLLPDTMLADTLFGSMENLFACAEQGVTLITPTPGLSAEADEEVHWKLPIQANDPPATCPAGHEVLNMEMPTTNADSMVDVHMAAAHCATCPRQSTCGVKPHANGSWHIRLKLCAVLSAQRRAFEKTPEFWEQYNARAGIEGTISEVKRGQGLGNLRVRGGKRVNLRTMLALTACNVKRALNYWVSITAKSNIFAILDFITSLIGCNSGLTRRYIGLSKPKTYIPRVYNFANWITREGVICLDILGL